jgi:hypothetical protein
MQLKFSRCYIGNKSDFLLTLFFRNKVVAERTTALKIAGSYVGQEYFYQTGLLQSQTKVKSRAF